MDLYQEIILDHFKHPRNQGSFDNEIKTLSCDEANVGCGDELRVSIVLDQSKQKIADIKWVGQGCAMSIASMSLLSEHVKGMTVAEVKAIGQDTLLELLGLDDITPAREKCMMLSVKAVHRALLSLS